MKEFGKDTFWNCLKLFLVEKMRKLAKTRFELVLEYFQEQRFGSQILMIGKWRRVSPRVSRLVDSRERMNKMRVYGVFILSYGAIDWSSNMKALADSSVCFRIIWSAWGDEEWRFFRIIEVLRLSHNSTLNIFAEERFAAVRIWLGKFWERQEKRNFQNFKSKGEEERREQVVDGRWVSE